MGAVLLAGCGGHGSSKKSQSTAAAQTSQPTSNPNALKLPEPRAEHRAVVLPSGDVFVAGGLDSAGTPLASTVIIGMNNTVIPGPSMATPRAGHTMTLLPSGQVLVAGGHSDAAGSAILDSSEIYDPVTQSFAPGPQLRGARSGHVAAIVTTQVLIAGGVNAGAALDTVEAIDITAGTSSTLTINLNTAQTNLKAAVLDNGGVLIASGQDINGQPVQPEIYDPATGMLTQTALVGPARTNAAVAAVGSGAIVAGGETTAGAVADTEVLDATNIFGRGPALSTARWNPAVAVLPGNVFAFVGGWDGAAAIDRVEVGIASNLTTINIQGGPQLVEARYGHTVSVRGTETLIVVGGWSAPGVALDTVEQVKITPPAPNAPAPGVTPPGPVPPGAITSYPFTENFDGGLTSWTQSSNDDFDWDQNTGSTTSSGTGPTSDHTSGTGSYLYTEASSPNYPSKVAILEGPTFASFNNLELKFWYHMYGIDMGTLSVDVSTDQGQTWTQGVWSESGDKGNRWNEAVVDLSSYRGQAVTIRFRGETGPMFESDMAIDDITVDNKLNGPTPPPGSTAITTYPYTENLDAGLGQWTQSANDDMDWDPNQGSTTSSTTGPTADHTSGNGGYFYTEASYPNYGGKIAILDGPKFGAHTNLTVRFWYHMYGQTMGSLDLEVSTDNGQTWTSAWTMSGDQGNQWSEAVVNLSQYAGQDVKLRFKGVTGSDFWSDMAIDDIRVTN